jgi:hypothetical protein
MVRGMVVAVRGMVFALMLVAGCGGSNDPPVCEGIDLEQANAYMILALCVEGPGPGSWTTSTPCEWALDCDASLENVRECLTHDQIDLQQCATMVACLDIIGCPFRPFEWEPAPTEDAAVIDALVIDAGVPDAEVSGGRFALSWSLVDDASGVPLSCSDVSAGSVVVTTTPVGGGASRNHVFDCEAGEGITDQLPLDTYTVVVEVLEEGTELALGTSVPRDETLDSGSGTLDLGNFEFNFL